MALAKSQTFAWWKTQSSIDPTNDLAVIRVEAGEDLPDLVTLGDSDELKVGQFVLAISNPSGLEQALTTGVISALRRIIESPEEDRFIGEAIQTDAAIALATRAAYCSIWRGR